MWVRTFGGWVRLGAWCGVCWMVMGVATQANASDARRFAETLHREKLHYGFSKEGKVALLKGDKEAHLGVLGSGYHSLFQGSEVAQKAGSQAHAMAISATILSILGIAASATGAAIFAVDPQGFLPEHRPARAVLNASLLFGGLALLYGSMLLNIQAQEKTYFAIKAYNRDLEKKALREWKPHKPLRGHRLFRAD